MFDYCISLQSIDLSELDVQNVQSMYYMLYNCESLTSIILSNLNTTNLINMEWMFAYCIPLK